MKLGKSILFIASAVFLACSSAFALSAQEAMSKSQAWFKTANAWSLDFKLQVFYAESPDVASQQGSLLVAEGNRFKLDIAGIKFYSDGESLWQYNVDQKQVLIKAVEDLSSSLHPSELLFKYLNCKAEQLGEVILNKLLKTLENPPPHTTIFFLATQENFPATILSRANIWRSTPPATAMAAPTVALGPELQKALQGFFQGTTTWSVLQETLKAQPEAEAALLAWISWALAHYPASNYAKAQQLQTDWQQALHAQKWHRPLAASFYILLTGMRQHLPDAPQSLV